MKKRIVTAALLAVLTTVAVSCQKETVVEPQCDDGNNYPLVPLNSMKNLEWVTKHPAPTTSEVDNICIYNQ